MAQKGKMDNKRAKLTRQPIKALFDELQATKPIVAGKLPTLAPRNTLRPAARAVTVKQAKSA